MNQKTVRVLIAKLGLDGHDRGAKIIARSLRDAGFEVIYTGIRQTPEQVASAAIQEDVQAMGLSSLSGAHNLLFPKVMKVLSQLGGEDILVFAGGVISEEDVSLLKACGIAEVFGPGTSTKDVIQFLKKKFG